MASSYVAMVVEGEMLSLTKVTRSEMGAYMCIASNGVPPSVSKRMKLQVHCKLNGPFLTTWTLPFSPKVRTSYRDPFQRRTVHLHYMTVILLVFQSHPCIMCDSALITFRRKGCKSSNHAQKDENCDSFTLNNYCVCPVWQHFTLPLRISAISRHGR